MVHDHRSHVTRTPTWACVCARVGEGGPSRGHSGTSRGLGGVEPVLWGGGGLRRFRRSNQPRRESLGRTQEMREGLGVKIHHPFQGAAPSHGPGLRPSYPLPSASPTPSPPGLPLVCCRENRESGLRRARHPLGMLGRRDRLAPGGCVLPPRAAAAAPAATAAAPRPAHPRGRWEPPGSAGTPSAHLPRAFRRAEEGPAGEPGRRAGGRQSSELPAAP